MCSSNHCIVHRALYCWFYHYCIAYWRENGGRTSYISPFTTLGNKGGDKERTISIAQLPYHTHPFKYAVQGSGGGINNLYGMPYNASANGSVVSVSGEPPTTGEIRTGVMGTGGGQALPIMNPYIVLNYEVVAM